jgi:hypothetical protein
VFGERRRGGQGGEEVRGTTLSEPALRTSFSPPAINRNEKSSSSPFSLLLPLDLAFGYVVYYGIAGSGEETEVLLCGLTTIQSLC